MHSPLIKQSLHRVFHPLDYEGRQQAKEAKLEKRLLKENKPKPLPSSRINISQESIVSQSASFFCLPLELRLQIYGLVLGDRFLHLMHFPGSIKHIGFDFEPTGDSAVPKNQPAAYNVAFWRHVTTTGLPMLLTCKSIHREAIEVLYSSNTFSLSDLNILTYWSDLPLVRRQHLQMIRHLSIRWTYYSDPGQSIGLVYEPYNWATWQRFWTIVSKEMPDLRRLDLRLEYVARTQELSLEQPFVKTMMGVRGIEKPFLEISQRRGIGDGKRCPEVEAALTKAWKQRHEQP